MKQNYLLYHKTVHCSRNNDFLSKIEIEIGIDRYRSSFRFLGRGEGGEEGVYEFRFRKNPVEGNKGRASTRRQKREWASERKG